MKAQIVKLAACFGLFITTLASCTKERPLPVPTTPEPTGNPVPAAKADVSFRISKELSGAPYHSSNLTAVLTLTDTRDSVVADEKILTLTLGNYSTTANLQLPVGMYKLTRFRLVYGSVNTHFAAPLSGSTKAASVLKPLALSFAIPVTGASIPVEVLKIAAGEGPQQYGYPAGTFDNGQEEADPFMKVKIKAIMQVGKVLYENIGAPLTLTTWNAQGEQATSYLSLTAGVNYVNVPKAATKYNFHISKWGTTDDLALDRQNVDTATVYVLGGHKEAKKLTSERTYVLVNGAYVPESKTDYTYDGNRLVKVDHYLRDASDRPYLASTESFLYSGERLEKISRFDGKNAPTGSTTFAYNQDGNVRSMTQLENGRQINATVDYLYRQQPEATIRYSYSDQTYTTAYTMILSGGNILASTGYIENQLSETSSNEYDSQINPYVHMGWPDLYFSRFSKNNLVRQYNTYEMRMPLTEPYTFNYTYDADGYPKELVQQFRTLPDRRHTKTTKTVYVY